MAISKADRMKENAMKQVDAHNADGGLFAGMEPIQEPAAEPKKKRGRPRKVEQKPQNASDAPEAVKARKAPAKKENAVTATDTKPQRKSDGKAAFSVWLDQATAADVKRYSAISGEKLTDVVQSALVEYMTGHPLTQQQKDDYKRRMLQNINDI